LSPFSFCETSFEDDAHGKDSVMQSNAQLALEEDFRSQLRDYGSRYDPISGLPNQYSFRPSIRKMVETAAQAGEEIVLLWLDVLNFRREYSIGGDEGAQRLVTTVADALRYSVGEGELICRFSDRCFLLALKRDSETATRLSKILEAAARRNLLDHEGKPEIAGGAAFFPQDSSVADELIRFASLAAVSAARTRSRGPMFFHSEMNTALLYERDLEKDLRAALHNHELTLAYQPQIDLTTGSITGVEGLTRWNHPVRGPVSPAHFIPVAERSNLIDEIFQHSLHQLLADAAKWRAAGLVVPSLAVNASAANVRHEDFIAIVKEELEAQPTVGSQLDIEVTESLLMDDESLFIDRLRTLRSIGVKVSLDDFGTRYTGFNALKGLPLSTMKIDKCFVHGVDHSSQAQSLCRTIVMMARQLKLGTVAEGIETAGELRALQSIGCQSGQGYFFKRPIPADQFLRFALDWRRGKKFAEMGFLFENDSDQSREQDTLFGVA
jgi:EAL domain-containing protein (putative c-di-GMP-specific phosphodiesterase class I)/GGDEF domain-containing protein